jgi:hypothetical protein
LFAHSYENADFADQRVIALTEGLIGADKAVASIKKKGGSPEGVVPDNLIRDTPVKDRPIVKKERMRFTLAASYIGGKIHREAISEGSGDG